MATAVSAAITAINAANTLDELKEARIAHAGDRSALALANREIGALPPAAKAEAGKRIGEARGKVNDALASRTQELEKVRDAALLETEAVDVTTVSAKLRGGRHPLTTIQEQISDVFIALGYAVAEGPEVETDFYNFEALNMPKTHPARSEFDTMFIEPSSPLQENNSVLLRTHTSPVQIRVMQDWKPPIYAVMPGRVFRRDTPDATHMPVFHQIEGMVIDKGITFAHLAGIIEAFTKAFFGSDFTSRLRPSFFPFTEPSAEFDIRRANGAWIELGGCGMMHPNVLAAGGIDPEEYTGFAFGFGIDRMAKERHNVDDIREMYTNDLRFLRQFS
jgi:phenylalanyl-tRNA synthetase alpha chain